MTSFSHLTDYEQSFEDFWKNIVCDENGNLDLDKLKRELHDYRIVIEEVTKVYCHVTCGHISKPNADSIYVIQAADDYYRRAYGRDDDQSSIELAMEGLSGIESTLFEWVECEDAAANYCVYSSVILKQQIGQFPKGTAFLQASIDYEDAELELVDNNGDLHIFKCFLTVE